MDSIPDKIDSKFRYVLLASHRAEQMMQGSQPKIELPGEKTVRVAMEEISRDLVEWDYGPEPQPEPVHTEEEETAEDPLLAESPAL